MMRFGFGCAHLYAGRSRRCSLELLEAAFANGITHFDTARLYGHGDAEGLLGAFARGRRDKLTVVTKAGILPTRNTLLDRAVGKSLSVARARLPGLARIIPEPPVRTPTFGQFAPGALRSSVETSLRQLGTDYVDMLLLHEYTLADRPPADVQAVLDDLKREGKIRAYGLATGIEETLDIARAAPALAPAVQIPSDAWNRNITRLPETPKRTIITHSVLAGGFKKLLERLRSDDALAKRVHEAAGVDPAEPSEIGRLLLAHALEANPNGVVLFSTSKVRNIEACTSIVTSRPVLAAQIAGLLSVLQTTG